MSQIESNSDFNVFGGADRKELIRHGFQLDRILEDIKGQGASILQLESRLRNLEDSRAAITAQIKTSLIWVSIIASLISAAVSVLMTRIVPHL